MRSVAGNATLRLDHRMLVHERPGFFGVALEAHRILRGSGPQLARQESAMRIMAIAALHQPFVNTMMKGSRELLLGFEMAAVAELWLLLFHQKLASLRIMRRMAVRATDVVLEMGGARKIAVLLAVGMTAKTTLADFLRGGVLKAKDLRFVASPVDVGLSRTVTCLAAMPLGPFLCIQSRDVVRGIFIALEEAFGWHVFVAGLAGFRSDVKRRVGGTFVRFRLACGLCFVLVLLRETGNNEQSCTSEGRDRQ